MRLSLAITSALLFGSYVTAIPVEPQYREESPGLYFPWEQIGSEASGSGPGNNFDALASHDAIYPPPNPPPPGHPSLSHYNIDNFPGPPEGQPPLHQVLGDSRGGLFGLPYRCTGCGRQSPGPEPEPGPEVDHPVPNTPVNHDNPNPSTHTAQGGADRRVSSTRAQRKNAGPYTRPNRSGTGGFSAGESNGGEPGPGVDRPVPSTPDNPNPSTRPAQGGADRRVPRTRAQRKKANPYARPDRSGAGGSDGGAVGVLHATGGGEPDASGSGGGGPDAEGNFQCPESGCDYSTRRGRGALNRHAIIHSTERNHACPNCDATFKVRNKLTKHHRAKHPESVPLPENPPVLKGSGPRIQCPVSGCPSVMFNHKSTVDRHLAEKHDINPKIYPCTTPGCDKTFTRPFRLRSHQERYGHS